MGEIRSAVVTVICDASGSKSELIGRRSVDLLCFLKKAGSALAPIKAMWCSKGGLGNASKQTVYGRDTLYLYLEKRSKAQFPKNNCRSTLVVILNALTANLYDSLVIQTVVLTLKNSIQDGVFQQDNARPHTSIVTQ
ncbi:phospholipid-transporting ATPase [Trichonephila clavipes]|nr:phospholipid-transporting ATPase [Trichonephila clavipes]